MRRCISSSRDACEMNGFVACLAIIAVVAGAFLVLYSVTYTQSVYGVTLITKVEYPYQIYGYISLLFGFVGLVLAFVMSKQSESF